jgi:hypothetical protein
VTFDDGKTYMKTEGGEFGNYEVISIGDTTYTKAGDTWWKQTSKPAEQEVAKVEDFKPQEPDESKPETEQPKYEKQGKEACGDLQCFKYKVVDPSSPNTNEFIWFDDKDYLIRKQTTATAEGTATEITYTYSNISVSEPSPVKELAPNQYIMPGQTEPVTIPGAEEFNQ